MENKQKRITLKTVHEMLDGMSVELAEKVHRLFMADYIDYSDYDFRDENQVESYCWCYRDLFELKTKASQEIVNRQLIEFLDEWRQDDPSRYRKAKDDICYWITDEWYGFESPMQKEIELAYQTALKKKDDLAIALALSPFARKTAELVKGGAYEAAAGSSMPSSDVWPRRARSMKTGSCVPMVASVTPTGMPSALALQVTVIPTRNWRYSPRQ